MGILGLRQKGRHIRNEKQKLEAKLWAREWRKTHKAEYLRAARKWYRKNKEKARQARLKHRRNLIEELKNLKTEQPCADCGLSFPHYILEFDHCEGIKSHSPAHWATCGDRGRLLAELMVCDIVCANCHNTRTWKRAEAEKNAH